MERPGQERISLAGAAAHFIHRNDGVVTAGLPDHADARPGRHAGSAGSSAGSAAQRP
jgi:aspartate 1-decarboxylase